MRREALRWYWTRSTNCRRPIMLMHSNGCPPNSRQRFRYPFLKIFRIFVGFPLKCGFVPLTFSGGCVHPAWPMLGYSIQPQVEYDSVVTKDQQKSSFLLIFSKYSVEPLGEDEREVFVEKYMAQYAKTLTG